MDHLPVLPVSNPSEAMSVSLNVSVSPLAAATTCIDPLGLLVTCVSRSEACQSRPFTEFNYSVAFSFLTFKMSAVANG